MEGPDITDETYISVLTADAAETLFKVAAKGNNNTTDVAMARLKSLIAEREDDETLWSSEEGSDHLMSLLNVALEIGDEEKLDYILDNVTKDYGKLQGWMFIHYMSPTSHVVCYIAVALRLLHRIGEEEIRNTIVTSGDENMADIYLDIVDQLLNCEPPEVYDRLALW